MHPYVVHTILAHKHTQFDSIRIIILLIDADHTEKNTVPFHLHHLMMDCLLNISFWAHTAK